MLLIFLVDKEHFSGVACQIDALQPHTAVVRSLHLLIKGMAVMLVLGF